jgi:hypothetical protein
MLEKIEGWRAKTLSQVGRTVLIKAIASSIPSYTMSIFLLPKSLCTALDKSFKNFLWGFLKGNFKIFHSNLGALFAFLAILAA